MTDIAERLRNKPLIVCQEAADEIERLREHVDALRLVATAHEPEIERMRAALQEIADMGTLQYAAKAVVTARRALEPMP